MVIYGYESIKVHMVHVKSKLRSKKFHLLSESGFTLVELLTVFALIGILTAIGMASYSSYNASQVVKSSESNVATALNAANSEAISQVIPSSCGNNVLTGYQVDITVNGSSYTLSAICGGKQVVDTYTLPPQVTFASGSTASTFFNVSSGTAANVATILITGYGTTKTITVGQEGSVTMN